MEKILELKTRLKLDESLLKFCKVQLLSKNEIEGFCNKDDWQLNLKINIEYDLAYEKLYIGKWNEVPEEYRRMFLVLSFLKAFHLVKKHDHNRDRLLSALQILDSGIIIGSGLDECPLLTEFAELLHEFLVSLHPPDLVELQIAKISPSDICEIDVLDQPSEELFWTKYFHLHRPAKLLNSISHWPAATKWLDLNYFMKTAGYRTVPIELGKKYDNDDWSQGMFRFGEFLKEFMSSESSGSHSGYLAQHDLFDQIPQLRKDIAVPDYCAIGASDPVIKSWIGPSNTISTMHTDDKHNLLCQVMGEKLVILASPMDKSNLYPYEGLLSNTSQVDPENLNFDEFPLAKNVKFLKLILKAGEILFIPKLWHHYVRSLTPSISVSFWFDVEENDSNHE